MFSCEIYDIFKNTFFLKNTSDGGGFQTLYYKKYSCLIMLNYH